jgi:ferric-dicitrate binding protein FerR (iron transport regulator)
MIKNRIMIDFEIIWKKANLSLTAKEELALSKWLKEDASHQEFLNNATTYYSQGASFEACKIECTKAWNNFKHSTLKKNNRQASWIISTAAAAIAVFVYFTYFHVTKKESDNAIALIKAEAIHPGSNQATLKLADGTVHDLTPSQHIVLKEGAAVIKSEGAKLQYAAQNQIPAEIKYNTLTIPRGGEFFLELADGTKVWLNSETSLRYPAQFGANERRVELTGEAYFEVAHNENSPFIVESRGQTVKDIGTEFNISAYTENPIVTTTLVKGSVAMFANTSPDKVQTLEVNEQGAVNRENGKISKRIVGTYQYIAWKSGRFVFTNQPLAQIMETLARWYNVEVVFSQEELKNFRFTGDLKRYTDFSEVIKLIGKTNEVNFLVEEKKITIR